MNSYVLTHKTQEHINTLLAEAKQKHGKDIQRCGNKKAWHECLTHHSDHVFLWFNTPSGDTSMVKIKK